MHRASLLVAESLHGIESGGTPGRIEARSQTDEEGKQYGEHYQPPGDSPEMLRWKRLPLEIDIRAQVDDLSDSPAEGDPNNAAENAHGACFCEEKSFHVAVAGSDRLHNSDFPATLENGHHQRVYDPNKSDSQCEAAEDTEKYVQHFEELLDTATGIKYRESVEAHFLDCIFYRLHSAGVLHAHAHRGINRLVAG